MLVWSVRQSFGRALALWTWLFLISSAGMFHAAVSYLPSSGVMYLVALCWAFWAPSREQPAAAVLCVAAAVVLCWPFAALLGAPLALELLLSRAHGPARFCSYALRAALAITPPVLLADRVWYGRWTLSTLNVLAYNLLPKGVGSELYGTEPASFYAKDLALNLNLALPLAALALPLLCAAPHLAAPMAAPAARRLRLMVAAAWLWVGFFSLLPHKEERFMFPAYPPLCLAAAVGADALVRLLARLLHPPKRSASAVLALSLLLGGSSAVLSAARVGAIVTYYAAPLRLFGEISRPGGLPAPDPRARVSPPPPGVGTRCDAPLRLCVGAEWYRFPASFLLPEQTCLSFVRSEFRGILPQPFAAHNGTHALPLHMNELNREEPSRYVPTSACHYLLTLEGSDEARALSRGAQWETALRAPMIDAARSPTLTRALWIPWVSARKNAYGSLALMKRVG
ncbi:Alg9-like mannosyltransferase family-domain-containing protein [Pavlovales sp. CCMP2436]|nr:Alg9-like mannosyltransferase family-domain-containing protein [Pavlovales sp. CCMP2436]